MLCPRDCIPGSDQIGFQFLNLCISVMQNRIEFQTAQINSFYTMACRTGCLLIPIGNCTAETVPVGVTKQYKNIFTHYFSLKVTLPVSR